MEKQKSSSVWCGVRLSNSLQVSPPSFVLLYVDTLNFPTKHWWSGSGRNIEVLRAQKRRQLDCFRVTSQDCHDLDDWAAPKTRNIKLNYFLSFLVWQHSQHIDKLNSAACKANFLRVLSLLWSDNKNCKLLHRSVVSKTKMDIDLKKIMYSLGNIYFNFVYIHFVFFFPLKTLVL